MGILLKLILFGVACYGVYSVARRWYGILGGGTPQPKAPPPTPREAAPPPPKSRPAAVEDAQLCPACGSYVSTMARHCGRADCPRG